MEMGMEKREREERGKREGREREERKEGGRWRGSKREEGLGLASEMKVSREMG